MLPNLRAPEPVNSVTVDPSKEIVAGKNYPTYALALAYVNTQSPSLTNPWSIKIGGVNSEAIIVYPFVMIDLSSGGRLTGTVDSAGAVTHPKEFVIKGGEIADLNLSPGTGLVVDNCFVTGGTPGAGGMFAINGTWITGGDFTALVALTIIDSFVEGGSFPPALSGNNARFGIVLNGSYTLSGSTGLYDSSIAGVPTINAGTYILKECVSTLSISLGSGVTFNLDGGTWNGIITYDSGGVLNDKNVAGLTVVNNGGTRTSEGAAFDPVPSGVSVANIINVQKAIDMLFGISVSENIIVLNENTVSYSSDIEGKQYGTYSDIKNYLSDNGTISSSSGGIATIPDDGRAVDYWKYGELHLLSGANDGNKYPITASTPTSITATGLPDGETGTTYQVRKSSPTNKWAVLVSGNVTEAIAVLENISIVGTPGTILSGIVTASTIGTSSLYNIVGAIISNLQIGAASAGLLLDNCKVTGGNLPINTNLQLVNTDIESGLAGWSNLSSFIFKYGSITQLSNINGLTASFAAIALGAVTLGSSIVSFSSITSSSLTLAGNSVFDGTDFNLGGLLFITGAGITIRGGSFATSNFFIPTGVTLTLDGVRGYGQTITVNTGGTIQTKNCVNLIIVNAGGTHTELPSIESYDSNRLTYTLPLDRQDIFITTGSGNVYFETEKIGGGNITFKFGSTILTLDCTTGAGSGGRAQVQLTEGSATTIQFNWIYVYNNAGVATLAASTSYPIPSGGFSIVAVVAIKDDVETAADGPLLFQRYTDSPSHDDRGRIGYMGEKIRRMGTTYDSGCGQTGDITTNVGTPDNVDITVATGIVYQMHRQIFPSLQISVNNVWVANASGAGSLTIWEKLSDLNQCLELVDGTAITNNQRFNLVIFGCVNNSGESKLFVNLSTDIYINDDNAYKDSDNTAITSVPIELRQTAFLICRIPLKYTSASGGTWSFVGDAIGKDKVISLLGLSIGASGQGAGVGFTNEFQDSLFRLFNVSDPTKQIDFLASKITTGTKRTFTMPDKDIVGGVADIPINMGDDNSAPCTTINLTWTRIRTIIFRGTDLLGTPSSVKFITGAAVGETGDIRIQDVTNNNTIAEITGFAAAKSIQTDSSLTNLPTGEAEFEVQMQSDGGAQVRCFYAVICFI